jgi:beta-xylosidase
MPRTLTTRAPRRALLLTVLVFTTACQGDDDDESATTSSPQRATTTSVALPTTSTTVAMTTSTSIAPSGGPAWRDDFPDPFVLADGDHFYAYATQAGLIRIQRLTAETPRRLTELGEALAGVPSWAAPYSTWAPAVLRRGDRYLLFYAALVAGTDRHCIGRAVASTPLGPFVDHSAAPFLCPMDLGGAIDPSLFVDDDGRVYLLWKNDGVTLRREAALWSLPLRHDGTAGGEASTRLLDTDQRWEYPHVEAPSMTRIGSTYWLAYSGNWWNDAAYGIGLARCENPLGPCTKPLDAPILASRPGAYGPGGLEFFRDRDGRLLAAYHAWLDTPGYPGSRALWISTVDTTGPVLSIMG